MTTKINRGALQLAERRAAAALTELQSQAGNCTHLEFLVLLPLIDRAAALQRDIAAARSAIDCDLAEAA